MIWQPIGPVRGDDAVLAEGIDVGKQAEGDNVGALLAADYAPGLPARSAV